MEPDKKVICDTLLLSSARADVIEQIKSQVERMLGVHVRVEYSNPPLTHVDSARWFILVPSVTHVAHARLRGFLTWFTTEQIDATGVLLRLHDDNTATTYDLLMLPESKE